jgi:LacI family transcriptional regulator
LAKAKEFNYSPNPFASGLRRNKSKTVAVVVPEVAIIILHLPLMELKV